MESNIIRGNVVSYFSISDWADEERVSESSRGEAKAIIDGSYLAVIGWKNIRGI